MKLMLIEDDVRLSEYLTANLSDSGFKVTPVPDFHRLNEMLNSQESADVIVLDRLLGTFDAKDSLPQIRSKWPQAPVLVLSAISTPNERTDLINQGADDYMSKPFSTPELVARLRALVRRSLGSTPTFTQVGDLKIDALKRTMQFESSVGSVTESLTAKEYLVLQTLAQSLGRVWSRADLLATVWDISTTVDTNVVEATVTNLRKKIHQLGCRLQIKNARNAGYWIEI